MTAYANYLRGLRQEDHLSPGIWGQPGQYSKTYLKKKKKKKKVTLSNLFALSHPCYHFIHKKMYSHLGSIMQATNTETKMSWSFLSKDGELYKWMKS
jgi:hypothetical protein